MKKAIMIVASLGCLAGMALADVVNFKLHPSITASSIGGLSEANGNVTITSAYDGNDLIFSMSRTGMDLDGGGVNNDTISWDLRFKVYRNVTITSVDPKQVILPASTSQAFTDGVAGFWDGSAWNKDTLAFSIENISLTADAGYTASFTGFTGLWLTAGGYRLGVDPNTSWLGPTANGDVTWAPQETLYITANSTTERNRDLVGSFTVIPEPATLGLVVAWGGGLLFIRRLLQM